MRKLAFALLASLVVSASAQHPTADGAQQTFTTLTTEYFNTFYWHYSPSSATGAGLHQYDTQLENYSADTVKEELADLHSWQKKFEAIPTDGLDAEPRADLEILLNNIRSQILLARHTPLRGRRTPTTTPPASPARSSSSWSGRTLP